MRLVMAGIDYTTAGMAEREAFVPAPGALPDLLRGLVGGEVDGCVLLSTCNRTELYLSHHGDVPPDAVGLLCRAFRQDPSRQGGKLLERAERQAVTHLMRVSAGLDSSVPGDDQILTQVRAAAEAAREAETADPMLEALFRAAVAAGKKVRTRVRLARKKASVALQGVDAAGRVLGTLENRRCLVVGNGLIARLAAEELLARGCAVAMTIRDRRRLPDVPPGCTVVEYDKRDDAMDGCDCVVAATSSPRHVIRAESVARLEQPPKLFVDLAIPRDVDPAVGLLDGVRLLNIDDFPAGEGAVDNAAREEALAIVRGEAERFDLWRRSRRRHTMVRSGTPDFPLFISLDGVEVLIAGGGTVAARRADKLLGFGAAVHAVSPDLSAGMRKLVGRDRFRWTQDEYRAEYLDGVTLAIAATSSRETNRRMGADARRRGILVSVADRRQECTFYFPAIVRSDSLTAGMISNHGDHRLVRRAAARVLREMEAIEEDGESGEQGQPAGCGPGETGHGGHRPAPSGGADGTGHDEDRRRPDPGSAA